MDKLKEKKLITAGGILAVTILAGCTIYFATNRNNGPLPNDIKVSVKFPLYYPSSDTPGYKYQFGSARNQNGIVFYNLQHQGEKITVSQQALPDNPPDINNIPGFKKLETFAGNAAIGQNNGQPTAILMTNTTLVTLSGTDKVPQDVLIRILQSMSSI